MKNLILSFGALLFALSVGAQEIDVMGKNVSIPSGSVTYTAKRNTFFGYQVSSAGSITKTFAIKNYGTANLTVGVVTATGNFTIASQPTSPVAPGGFTTFTVTFDPASVATLTGTITIPNNDANEGTYTFGVQGVGLDVTTQRRVRWVNNTGLPQPGTVVLQGVTYNVVGPVYTTVQTAITAAAQYDIVYITDGRYFNPREAISTTCNIVGMGQDLKLYDSIQNKNNIIITSSTGNYTTSNVRIVGSGFNLKGGTDITIQGLRMDSCRVNAFWNSNCCTYDPTTDVKILNNHVNRTYGHGIKTDYWANGQGSVIDRGAWEIKGNRFENIGAYAGYFGTCTLGAVSAMWLGEAGGCFEIDGNTIINVRWAGILCNGYGDAFTSANGAVTISNNTINGTVNAGIQLGWNFGGNGYPADWRNSYVTGNYIQNANTSNAAGIGAITVLISYVGNTNILRNHITSSYNGVAINIAGWNNSMAADTSRIQYNNFCGLTAGSSAITHIGGQNGNGFWGTPDNLGKYKCDNNYYGSASGPTYYLNPGGIGWELKEEATLISPGVPYSQGDFAFLPFRTIPYPNALVPACQCQPNSSNTIVTGCGSYLWNSVNYTTSGTYSHSMPGAGVGGCDSVAYLVLTISNPAVTALAQTNIACFGGNTGAASVNAATGGIAPYSYNWTPGNPTGDGTTSVTGLTAGTWTCTATDAAGCTATQTFNITQPAAPVSGTTVVTNVACFGGNTGAINLTPTGGTGPYTFNWLPSGPTTEDRTGLTAGTYTVQITDANGCAGTVTATVTQPTSPVSGTTVVTNVACFGGSTGAINLTPTGGTGPYTFNWLPSGPTTEDRTGLTAGTYTVQITDANGCAGTVTATVTQPTSPVSGTTVVTNVACFGGSTGAINLTPTGGTGPYTFNWLPSGPTTEDRTGLTAGTYTVQITDANGCAGTVTATVTQPTSPVSGTTVVTNVACFGGSTGAINLTPTGGTGPYTFNWLPSGPTTEDRTGLTAGTYTVQITDANGCAGTVTATVTQPTSPVSGTTVVTNVACFGGNTGAINLTPTGGTGPYTFNWLPSGPTTEDRTGLTAGTYTVQITDANGCAGTVTATVTQPTSPVSGTTVVTNVACFGGNTGAINLTPTGGTGPYTFNWLPSGPTTEDRTGLTAGTYTVQITDANGCAGTVTATVTQPTSPVSGTTVVTNVACFGGSTGAINLTPTGGTGPYTFNWLPSGPTTEDRTGLTAGTYTVQITDANGCAGTVTATVTQPTSPVSGTTVVTNVACFGGSTGAINLTPTGGTGPYTFNWLPSGPTTEDRTGLTAGTYTVQITDANGCAGTVTATVTQPTSPVSGTTVVTNVACFGGNTGAINLTPTGGTGPYTFNWLPSGPTTEDRTGLTAGTYTVQITDANGCAGTVTATVTQPTSPVSGTTVVTNVACFGGSTGAINLTPTGGTGPYTFNWLPSGPTTEDRTGLTAGTYTVQITDANGCAGTVTATVTQPTSPVSGTTVVTNVACFGGSTGAINLTPTGGTGPYTFNWLPSGPTTEDRTGLTAGTYTVQITDANGCAGTVTATVTQPTSPVSGTTVVTNVSCFGGSNGAINLTPSGGTAGYTYNWLPSGPTTEDRTGLAAGTYTVEITDANGCTGTVTSTVTEPPVLVAGSSASSISCNGGNSTVTVTGSGGTSPYTGTGTFVVIAGTHTYTVTDANGCTSTTTVVITEPSALAATSSATSIGCNGGNATVTVVATGGTAPYTGDGTFIQVAGTYTYTVTDANGCTTTTSITITEPTALAATSSATSIGCFGGNATVTVVATGGTAPYTGDGTFTEVAGTYSYTVTDANGCTTTTSVTITEPTALAATSSATSIACFGGNATVTVAATGGTAPYTGDGTFTEVAGTYSYTVTDANGCIFTTTITVTEPTAINASITTVDVLCNGGSTGSIDLTVSGGTGPYTFDWNSGTYTTEDLNNITAGTYTGTVTDANGCTNSGTVLITEPAALVATLTSVGDPTSCGGTDGTIDIAVSGGVTAYGFLWSNAATTEDLSGIGAGAYTCTVTDANGCTTTVGGNLNDPNAPTVTLSLPLDTVCVDDGAFVLAGESPAGGTFSGPGVSAGSFDPITAGVGTHAISYTFTDTSGCTGSTVDSIYVDICLDATTPVVSTTFTVYPNPNNGTFTLQLSNATTADVLVFDAQGKLVSTQKVQSNSQQIKLGESGVYIITVITAEGERSTQRVIVTE